jgi:glycine/D-amino acid oxidase-like deaminating enzyme/nitrite reductase/ring-hydroxylating ferredoxin subunit
MRIPIRGRSEEFGGHGSCFNQWGRRRIKAMATNSRGGLHEQPIQPGDHADRNRSYWIPDEATAYPSLKGTRQADVAVVGGGIVGLTTAFLLQRAGLQVIVIEANRIGQGTTGHSTAKLTALHTLRYQSLKRDYGLDAAKTYAAANQAGIEQVAQFVNELAINCDLERQAAYTFTCDASRVEEIRSEVDAALSAGLPASFTTDTQLPFKVLGAIQVENQAQFDPYRYCVQLGKAFADIGGLIYEQSRGLDVDQTDQCVVRTTGGEVRANHVVIATLLPFLDRGGYFACTYPSRSYGIAVQLESAAPEGMYISVESPVRSVRPMADRTRMIVVGDDHKVGHGPDTREHYAALEEWARRWFPVVAVTHRCSAQDYMPADDLPYIGRLQESSDRVFVVTGLRKWGLALGTSAATMLRDAIVKTENPWAPLFDSTRGNYLASARTLIQENLDVAKQFVGDRLRTLKAKDVAELARGEGGIVEIDGEKLAAYRDDSGTVHAVAPVCTHLGCYVHWNSAEKSWDCPCHGSRFDLEGRILQGPAVKDLKHRQSEG